MNLRAFLKLLPLTPIAMFSPEPNNGLTVDEVFSIHVYLLMVGNGVDPKEASKHAKILCQTLQTHQS